MDEIAKLKTQVSCRLIESIPIHYLTHSKITDLENTVTQRDKELLYLKRALESVYSRSRSREESKESVTDVDASLLASKAIEKMTQKEKELAVLQAEITDLKTQLAAKPRFITEKDFKAQVAPPPPPPPRPPNVKHVVISTTLSGETSSPPSDASLQQSPQPLSPPPPPPLQRPRASNDLRSPSLTPPPHPSATPIATINR